MNISKYCKGNLPIIWEDAGTHRENVIWGIFDLPRPTGVKRKRLKCPECGRRVLSSVRLCHDGCCIIHTLPMHKPKGWWKKKKDVSKHKERNIR